MAGLEGLALLWRGAELSRLSPAAYPATKSWRTNSLGAEVTCHFDPFFCPFLPLGMGGSSPYTTVSPGASSGKAVEMDHQGVLQPCNRSTLGKAPSGPSGHLLCLPPGGCRCTRRLNWIRSQARGAYIRYLLCAPRPPWEEANVLIR